MWRVVDGENRQFADALFVLNADLCGWISPADKALQPALVHGYIGMAECLYVMGKDEQAVTNALAIATTDVTPSQRAAIAWIRGLALFRIGRISEAEFELKIVSEAASYKYASEALRLLVAARAGLGNVLGANETFNIWAQRANPTPEQAAPLVELIERANRQSAVRTGG